MLLRALDLVLRRAAFHRRRRGLVGGQGPAGGLLEPIGEGLTLPDVREFAIRGDAGAYRIFVAVPPSPPPAAGWPVLWLLDGNAWIAGAAEALAMQGRYAATSEIDPPLIVAVGYPGADPYDGARRAYDYLPAHSSGRMAARFMQGAPWFQPGGATAFLDFLTGPLRTAIAGRYPVDSTRQVLCGHSFGGLFALRCLLGRPDAFSGYAALSPSLWWDEGRGLREAEERVDALPTDLSVRLFMAVGGREMPDRPEISARMLTDAAAFADLLRERAPPGVAVEHRVLAEENHLSLPTAAFPAMLRFATRRD